MGPLLPVQIVDGKFVDDAPGALEKCKSDKTGGGGGIFSTANCTVLDAVDSVVVPTSHSAVAVLVMTCGAVCASAGRLATGKSIPVVSAPAHFIKYLVNVPIGAKGDPGKPAPPLVFFS